MRILLLLLISFREKTFLFHRHEGILDLVRLLLHWVETFC